MAGYAYGTPDPARVRAAAERAAAGQGTADDAAVLLDLFRVASERGPADARRADEAEAKAATLDQYVNEIAARLADFLDGRTLVLADLPVDLKRRVNAYRHQSNYGDRPQVIGRDEHGKLPAVPVIARQRAERVVIIDG